MAALVLLMLAAAAPAAPAAVTHPIAAKPSDVVCRTEPDPGSRLTHRVCISRALLSERRKSDRETLEHIQQAPVAGATMVTMTSN